MPQPENLYFNAITHSGLKRSNNEDCLLSLPNRGLWLIADGMGGHEAGEVASAIVCETVKRLSQQPRFFLVDAIEAAHNAIIESSNNGIGAAGMGSTVVALQHRKKSYCIAWVGDSRAYLWNRIKGGSLTRLTTDHSYVQMLFASGAIKADELENHPDKNVITQCLGIQNDTEINIDIIERHWQKNQWVILCSDGLTDELGDAAMAEILAESTSSREAMQKLLAAALANGGRDNITLQIIETPIQTEQKSAKKSWFFSRFFGSR